MNDFQKIRKEFEEEIKEAYSLYEILKECWYKLGHFGIQPGKQNYFRINIMNDAFSKEAHKIVAKAYIYKKENRFFKANKELSLDMFYEIYFMNYVVIFDVS